MLEQATALCLLYPQHPSASFRISGGAPLSTAQPKLVPRRSPGLEDAVSFMLVPVLLTRGGQVALFLLEKRASAEKVSLSPPSHPSPYS